MKRIFFIMLLVVFMGLSGCSSTRHMKAATPEQIASYNTISPDESIVVFYRPRGFIGSAVSPSIIDSDDNCDVKFVSIIPNVSKFFYRTTPGKHRFFTVGHSIYGPYTGLMLEAELQAGLVYYVEYSPSRSPAFKPINAHIEGEGLKKDLDSCQWLENTSEGHAWFEIATPVALKERCQKAADLGESFRERQKEDFEKKSKENPEQYEADKAEGKYWEFYLRPEYGLNALIQ